MEISPCCALPKLQAPDRTEPGARRCLWVGAGLRAAAVETRVTPYQTRMLELLERLESTLDEVRDLLDRRERPAPSGSARALEAFAEDAFRDRDA